MKVFLEQEELKLANDLALIEQRKKYEKKKKARNILTIIAICTSVIGTTFFMMNTSYERERERKYQEAIAMQERGMYADAMEVFDKLYGYKDSDSLIDECEVQNREVRIEKNYENAWKKYEEGDYLTAALLFGEIMGYEDSGDMMLECYYEYGNICVENQDYAEAYEAFDNAEDYSDAEELKAKYSFAVAEEGDTIFFGKYEQDGVPENGEEYIEWYIIHQEENSAILLSKHILDMVKFYELPEMETTEETDAVYTYADSNVRKLVNKTFFDKAFSKDEKEKIIPMTIEGTENKVFLLPVSLVEEYVTDYDMRIASITETIKKDYSIREDDMVWWTSTISESSEAQASAVFENGDIFETSFEYYCGLRPAIYVEFVK